MKFNKLPGGERISVWLSSRPELVTLPHLDPIRLDGHMPAKSSGPETLPIPSTYKIRDFVDPEPADASRYFQQRIWRNFMDGRCLGRPMCRFLSATPAFPGGF